jgi:hypothetical protein
MWGVGYGAIPRIAREEDDVNTFPTGSGIVNEFPDRWRKAPVWVAVLLVCRTLINTKFR